jgi:CHAT domain-containing protein
MVRAAELGVFGIVSAFVLLTPSAVVAVPATCSIDHRLSAGEQPAPACALALKSAIEGGRLAGATDDFAGAERNYRAALDIQSRLYGDASVASARTLAELALAVSNQGRFAEAAALFHRAQPMLEGSTDDDVHAQFASYLALDAANRRRYDEAVKYAQDATAARRSAIAKAEAANGATENAGRDLVSQGELAHALRVQAEMALRNGDTGAAKASAEEALWIVSDEPGLPLWWRADTIALMGAVNEQSGREVAAEHDFVDARDLDLKLFGDSAPTAFADFRLGAFYARQEVFPAALKAYRAGFTIVDKNPAARGEVSPDDIVAVANAEAAAGDPAGRDAELFHFSQLLRAGLSERAIAQTAARRAAAQTGLADLIAETQAAERQRDRDRVDAAAEFAKPEELRDPGQIERLKADADSAAAHADDLVARVRKADPRYESLAEPAPAALGDVEARLAPHEAMVSFMIGRQSGVALVVRSDGFSAVPLAIGAEQLRADTQHLRRSILPVAGRPQPFDFVTAYALYQSLLAPVETHLANADRLVVVPGPGLVDLPFDTLVTNPASGGTAAPWLARRYALSEAPSPSAFTLLKSMARAAPTRALLGIGAPNFTGVSSSTKALEQLAGDCRGDDPIAPERLRALPPLPDTATELATVGRRIGGADAVLLTGGSATESALRAQPLGRFGVLYFATHGILPGELGCAREPALALSPPASSAQDRAGDGLLEAGEIANLDLNADLVVLSACNTAVIPDQPGGGALEALSDAFFAAGARAVLASRWEVSSATTRDLMTNVFAGDGDPGDVAQRLRSAELALADRPQTAHPYYWAAFTLMGGGVSGAPARLASTGASR